MRRRMGRPGLMGTMARTAVVAGTATAVSGGVRRHSEQNAAEQQQAAAAQQQAQQPPPPPAQTAAPAALSTDDKISQITELGKLKDAGLLTDEEFTTEKTRILGS